MHDASSASDRPLFSHWEWRQITWLINRQADEPDRWQGSADSQEYLALVRYLIQRNQR